MNRNVLLSAVCVGSLSTLLLGLVPQSSRQPQVSDHVPVVVLDTDGEPIRGVTVTLLRLSPSNERQRVSVGFTDGDGAIELTIPEPGSYEVHAFLDGFLGTSVGPLPLSLADRQSTRLLFPLVLTLNPVAHF